MGGVQRKATPSSSGAIPTMERRASRRAPLRGSRVGGNVLRTPVSHAAGNIASAPTLQALRVNSMLTSALSVCWISMATVAGSEDLLQNALVAHRAAVDALQSYQCRIDIRTEKPGKLSPRQHGYYSYSSGKWRLRGVLTLPNGTVASDTITVADSVVAKQRSAATSDQPSALFYPHRGFCASGCDVPSTCLLTIYLGTDEQSLPLDDVVRRARRSATAKRARSKGRELIRVVYELDLKSADGQEYKQGFEIDLDPEVNYLIRRCKVTYPGYPGYLQWDVTEFSEPAPGLFFPTKLTKAFLKDGKVQYTHFIEISELKVIHEIPAETFVFQCPHGTLVHDLVTMTKYEADETGKPLGKVEPLRLTAADPGVPAGQAANAAPGLPSRAEPPDPWRWLLWGSLALAVAGSAFWLWSRWRQPEGA